MAAPFYYPPYFFCKAVVCCFKKMKKCLGVDGEEIIHDIETGTLPTTPPQPARQQKQQKKLERAEAYEVFRYRKDVEAGGFHSGECVICLGEYEEDDECARLKKCKHTYHRACIDKMNIHAT
ncbi:PREDICTED: RING-H2 finger protein ATL64-like [Fragaria vesca subsp. vesca]|uniref:RING-H2 finger protein ATL64-like n=1 Tax=Fragaria vesca subsp. vesca TaxID=101020 RepID=UPI0002C2FEBD|nr:PREDICTED: RING-H2 finger protein ATL64-like [Fragaria vesca subsp. vesca]